MGLSHADTVGQCGRYIGLIYLGEAIDEWSICGLW